MEGFFVLRVIGNVRVLIRQPPTQPPESYTTKKHLFNKNSYIETNRDKNWEGKHPPTPTWRIIQIVRGFSKC